MTFAETQIKNQLVVSLKKCGKQISKGKYVTSRQFQKFFETRTEYYHIWVDTLTLSDGYEQALYLSVEGKVTILEEQRLLPFRASCYFDYPAGKHSDRGLISTQHVVKVGEEM